MARNNCFLPTSVGWSVTDNATEVARKIFYPPLPSAFIDSRNILDRPLMRKSIGEINIFGKKYDLIYGEGNELTSQQYPTDIGFIDILAKSKDDKEYLVIELKKGRSSDAVVGQTLRYISWVKRNLAEERKVKGTVVVLDAEEKLKYSLYDQKDISLFTYKVSFDLKKENF